MSNGPLPMLKSHRIQRQTAALPPDLRYPVSSRLFVRYRWVWGCLSQGILFGLLWLVLRDAYPDWGGREAILAGLVACQTALYLITFVFQPHWPLPWWWLTGYFAGGLGLWTVEWQLAAPFLYLHLVYFGQMFMILPPRVSIPVSALISCWAVGQNMGWRPSRFSLAVAGEPVLHWITVAIPFLYAKHASVTSSERAQLIADLHTMQTALEAARQKESELAVLRERERLARDLHDSLGHALVALSVQLEAIQRLYAVDPPRASALIDDTKALTRDSMNELRRALDGLRTSGLGERSLEEGLLNVCQEVEQRSGVTVTYQFNESLSGLGATVAEALWRVAQEALTNIEQHANATAVRIEFQRQTDTLSMRIIDDGQGVSNEAGHQQGHYGLLGMRERLEGLGGTLTLSPVAPHGTMVEASLPVLIPRPSQRIEGYDHETDPNPAS